MITLPVLVTGRGCEKLGQAPCVQCDSAWRFDVRSEPVPFFQPGSDCADVARLRKALVL
jgi:hypothetical protein